MFMLQVVVSDTLKKRSLIHRANNFFIIENYEFLSCETDNLSGIATIHNFVS